MTEHLCPLWGEPLLTPPKTAEGVYLVYSPRAGGIYGLTGQWGGEVERSGRTIAQLRQARPRAKANLSHWIYRQNLEAGLLRPPVAIPNSARHDVLDWGLDLIDVARRAPRLDPDAVLAQYARNPSALDRRLTLLNELLLQQDLPQPTDETKLHRVCRDYAGFRAAAAATTSAAEETEFRKHIEVKGWAIFPLQYLHHTPQGEFIYPPATCTLDARMWVEEQLRERSTNEQVFVAMWFDQSLNAAYKEGFAQGIAQAGYAPYRVDQDTHHSDKLDDRVLAGIRHSRIVVADFTCEKFIREGHTECEGRPNGNVHYEAGFAHGLGLPVIYTCHRACKAYLNFDTRQINHILWTDATDLARQLQARLEGQFGHGPVQHAPDA